MASSLNVSTRTLHRVLAACGETFGAMLIQARVDLAVRMLQSPLFDRLTTAEIGRRAGFSDASHFVRSSAAGQARRRCVCASSQAHCSHRRRHPLIGSSTSTAFISSVGLRRSQRRRSAAAPLAASWTCHVR